MKLSLYLGWLGLVLSRDTYLMGFDSKHKDSILKRVDSIISASNSETNLSALDPILEPLIEPLATKIKLVTLGDMSIGIIRTLASLEPLNTISGVRFIEKDQKIAAAALVNQENVPSFGLARISSRNQFPSMNYTYDDLAGVNVDVYVLDSGVNTEHEDFEGRAYMSHNFIDNEEDLDFYGHGTHVAGTVAGKKYGVAKKAKVFGVKILDKYGEGSVSKAVQAIAHVMRAAEQSGRKSIINLSLDGSFSQALNVAVDQAAAFNIPVVVAAGNHHTNACLGSPASAFHVLAIGNIDAENKISKTSNQGPCISLFAPGSRIVSASSQDTRGSKILSGTSMAAPHVAGVAALFWSQRPQLNTNQLYELIKSRATRNLIMDLPFINPNLIVYNQL